MNKKNANWMNEIQHSDLDLGGLTMPEFDWDRIRKNQSDIDAEQTKYKEKYGDDWFKKWWYDKNPKPDYDDFMKSINECIYYGTVMTIRGTDKHVHEDQARVFERMHDVYGDYYDELEVHAYGDPRAVELLLQDAIKTGKWKELPDCLQDEYHNRIENK